MPHLLGLDTSKLTEMTDGHFLLPQVASCFYEMQKAAAECGHDLQICSSYRSFDKQLSIWNRKWQGKLPLYKYDGEFNWPQRR